MKKGLTKNLRYDSILFKDKSMGLVKIDELLRNIKFDGFYLEATFQFKLLMQLTKIFDEDLIFPERNIEYYGLNPKNFSKKEVDIIVEQKNNLNIAMELKMPMNGQVPEQMFKFVEDIKFLEELKACSLFYKCYLIAVTNDSNFWQGNIVDGIYSFFRNGNILKGKVFKPTGAGKNIVYHQINGGYKINWKTLENSFRYFIAEV